MKYCKDCWGFDRCKAQGRTVDFPVDDGVCLHFDPCLPMTNADRIRAMSDEELAEWLKGQAFLPCRTVCGVLCVVHSDDMCKSNVLRWLQQPAEVE